MPSETFFNLPEAKREKIFSAAACEFAAHRFSEASINQIVKDADISRGSFYQYFDDKEDVYLYVLVEIAKEKKAFFSAKTPPEHAGFAEIIMTSLRETMLWARAKPLYHRIMRQMDLDDNEFVRKLREGSNENDSLLRAAIERDMKAGRIRPGIDAQVIVDIVHYAGMSLTQDRHEQQSEEATVRRLKTILDIIKGGISAARE